MPRRNNRSDARSPSDLRTTRPQAPLTTEDMARDLVHRGLAPALILDGPHLTQREMTP